MAICWLGADLLTGRIIADLPGMQFDQLDRTISASETATNLLLNLDANSPENWPDAIREGGSLVACYDDTDPSQAIMWCGYVTSIVLDATSNQVPISAATFEALFDRVYVGDCLYLSTQHRDDIIADLVNNWFAAGLGINYLQMQYTPGNGPQPAVIENPPVPNAALIFQNTDNATLQDRFNNVFGQLGGEFTIEWGYSTDRLSLVPTLVFGDQIGAAPAGPTAAVTFEMPGSLVAFNQTRDYSKGAGANKILPYSSGQGDSTPYGTPVYAPVDGRPIFEERYEPAPSISPNRLQQYARQAISIYGPGAQVIVMTSQLDQAQFGRRLGTDWFLGDTTGYRVPSSYVNEQKVIVQIYAFPQGCTGLGRAIGYQMTPSTITPVLAQPVVYEQS